MAAYDIINGYDPIQSFTHDSTTYWYQARIPTGANVSTPLGVIFWLAQAAHTMAQFGTAGTQAAAQACINDQRGDTFGTTTDTGVHSGYIVVFLPEYDGADATRAQWHTAFRACINHLEGMGYNINRRRINAAGWSTGAIQWFYAALKDPTLWNAAWLAESSMVSAAITDWGNGPPLGLLGAAYYDPPIIAVGAHPGDGNLSADTAMWSELASQLYSAGISFVQGMANNDSFTKSNYMTYWGRLINDLYNTSTADSPNTKSLIKEMQALGATVANSSAGASTALTVSTSVQAAQRYVSDAQHGPTNDFMYSTTNYPNMITWMNGRDKPITYVPPTPVRAQAWRFL